MQKQIKLGQTYSETSREGLCARCRGFMGLCGRKVCPILVKARTFLDLESLAESDIAGSAPPGVFVGSYGYPKVLAGPLIPPLSGDTMHMDSEEWLGDTFDQMCSGKIGMIMESIDAFGALVVMTTVVSSMAFAAMIPSA